MTLEEWRSLPPTQELIQYLNRAVSIYQGNWVLGKLDDPFKAQAYAAALNDMSDTIASGEFLENREFENDN